MPIASSVASPTCNTSAIGTGSCCWRRKATIHSSSRSETKSATAAGIRSSLKATRSATAAAASRRPAVAHPKWHACVRIDPRTYKQLKAFFLDRACHRSVENLAGDFARVPYGRYAPIRRQLLTIHRAVNEARSRNGFAPVPPSALRLRRTIVRRFDKADPNPHRDTQQTDMSSAIQDSVNEWSAEISQ